MQAYVVHRQVTVEECSWLDADIPKGATVYDYNGPTYGCVSSGGQAVTFERGVLPFFELPSDALTPVNRIIEY